MYLSRIDRQVQQLQLERLLALKDCGKRRLASIRDRQFEAFAAELEKQGADVIYREDLLCWRPRTSGYADTVHFSVRVDPIRARSCPVICLTPGFEIPSDLLQEIQARDVANCLAQPIFLSPAEFLSLEPKSLLVWMRRRAPRRTFVRFPDYWTGPEAQAEMILQALAGSAA